MPTFRFLIVDDHEAVLKGTIPVLSRVYPEADILTAQDAETAQALLTEHTMTLVVVDLSIPATSGAVATSEVGLGLVKALLSSDTAPNIAVLSTNIVPLACLKSSILAYEGGFVAIDKSWPLADMVDRIRLTMRGSVYLPSQVKSRPELHAKWLEMLRLRFETGLTDKAIAKRMNTSDRTIRNYWIRIQDAFMIPDDPDFDTKMQISLEAKKMGLIR